MKMKNVPLSSIDKIQNLFTKSYTFLRKGQTFVIYVLLQQHMYIYFKENSYVLIVLNIVTFILCISWIVFENRIILRKQVSE